MLALRKMARSSSSSQMAAVLPVVTQGGGRDDGAGWLSARAVWRARALRGDRRAALSAPFRTAGIAAPFVAGAVGSSLSLPSGALVSFLAIERLSNYLDKTNPSPKRQRPSPGLGVLGRPNRPAGCAGSFGGSCDHGRATSAPTRRPGSRSKPSSTAHYF
jgi:hypothetical protein